jgi:hypothetical protein
MPVMLARGISDISLQHAPNDAPLNEHRASAHIAVNPEERSILMRLKADNDVSKRTIGE